MKEASGELNMTLVTVLAIGAILLFVTTFVPKILNNIENNWGNDTTKVESSDGTKTSTSTGTN